VAARAGGNPKIQIVLVPADPGIFGNFRHAEKLA
jgi:hypothetical protein